jgi:hypothetical protein
MMGFCIRGPFRPRWRTGGLLELKDGGFCCPRKGYGDLDKGVGGIVFWVHWGAALTAVQRIERLVSFVL